MWVESRAAEAMYLSVLVLGEIRLGVERLRPRDPSQSQSLERWLAALRVARMRFYWRMNPTDTRILRVLLALRLY